MNLKTLLEKNTEERIDIINNETDDFILSELSRDYMNILNDNFLTSKVVSIDTGDNGLEIYIKPNECDNGKCEILTDLLDIARNQSIVIGVIDDKGSFKKIFKLESDDDSKYDYEFLKDTLQKSKIKQFYVSGWKIKIVVDYSC